MYDIIIIGGGVIGCSIARELSRYDLGIAVLEKSYDIANATTKANSGIVHAGYDAKPKSLMAKFNREGNSLFDSICSELEVPFKRIGSLVLALEACQIDILKKLYNRGLENSIPKLKLLERDEIIGLESSVSKNVVAALFAETAGVVSPYELAIAYAENACSNDVDFILNTEVIDIKLENNIFRCITNKKEYFSRFVINAAGIYSDKINNIISSVKFSITPKKGQYLLLSKNAGDLVKHVIFQCPSDFGKGILVTPTVYGNTLIGPDSKNSLGRDDVSIDENDLEYIKIRASKGVDNIPYNKAIKTFAGLRAESDTGDFIIGEAPDVDSFINVAGIKSPGLTSAPAIGKYISILIRDTLKITKEKQHFNLFRKNPMLKYTTKERADFLLQSNSSYANIICLCENISEGELVDAISRKPYPSTRDGVKRRARAGMGPCQGRRCGLKVDGILKS